MEVGEWRGQSCMAAVQVPTRAALFEHRGLHLHGVRALGVVEDGVAEVCVGQEKGGRRRVLLEQPEPAHHREHSSESRAWCACRHDGTRRQGRRQGPSILELGTMDSALVLVQTRDQLLHHCRPALFVLG
eukprot:3546162-Rhodomonas_salina.1